MEENNTSDFDEHDLKVLKCKISGDRVCDIKPSELDRTISGLLARIGVITGITIPSVAGVFDLTREELKRHILSDSRYSVMTIDEIVNAFHLFAKGLIGGDKQDYGKNFNLEYFSVIVQAYLRYRSEVFFKYERVQDLKATSPNSKHPEELNFYETTEAAYQQFLSGKFNVMLWNPNCYDTCVKVGWIQEDAFTNYMNTAKVKLMKLKSDEIEEFEKNHIKLDGNIYSTKDNLPVNMGKLMTAVFDLSKIKEGEPGWLIKNVAKQLCLEQMFKQAAISGMENLFVKTD